MQTLVGKYSEQVDRLVDRLPRIRKARGMSQQDVANASGIGRVAIGKIEVGARGLSLAEALAIAEALDVDLMEALSDQPVVLRLPAID
ncbi:helix-turn-helix transcriptional regulator [Micromonospora tulbaghiae]|uniref:helix-turn-helix domain-containing protein n=1 Tax=Micromonospora tulbaghiae TaxID=479978 RepID=UPI0034415C45